MNYAFIVLISAFVIVGSVNAQTDPDKNATTSAPANPRVFKFPDRLWGQTDLSLSQSTLAGTEAILGASANWEQLSTFPPNSRERQLSRPVGRLEIRLGDGFGVCTAFLISDSEIVTNNHCVPGIAGPVREAALFMGYYDFGSFEGMRRYDVEISPRITDVGLDVSVLRVRGEPGKEWGHLTFATEPPTEGDRLTVIQHPAGQIKHITERGCIAGPTAGGDPNLLLHRCDTEKGSSGSPILNQNGEVVALHFSGTALRGPGAYNFAKLGVAVAERIARQDPGPTADLGEFKELMFPEFLTASKDTTVSLDEEFAAACNKLHDARVTWVREEDIADFEYHKDRCLEIGAISLFQSKKLETMAAEMRNNYQRHKIGMFREISCPSIIEDIMNEDFSGWDTNTIRVSAFCGLNETELDVVRSGLPLRQRTALLATWQNDVENPSAILPESASTKKQTAVPTEIRGLTPLTADLRATHKIPDFIVRGLIVIDDGPGTLAQKMNFETGDVITSFDSQPVSTLQQIEQTLDNKEISEVFVYGWQTRIARARSIWLNLKSLTE